MRSKILSPLLLIPFPYFFPVLYLTLHTQLWQNLRFTGKIHEMHSTSGFFTVSKAINISHVLVKENDCSFRRNYGAFPACDVFITALQGWPLIIPRGPDELEKNTGDLCQVKKYSAWLYNKHSTFHSPRIFFSERHSQGNKFLLPLQIIDVGPQSEDI